MSEQKLPRIENWYRCSPGLALINGDLQVGDRVAGAVYDHPSRPPGHEIWTGNIIEVLPDRIVTHTSKTASGRRVYLLGVRAPDLPRTPTEIE